MHQLFNLNWLAGLMKAALGLAALLLSALLSFTFFGAISPTGMAVFPFAALTLTEGGLVGWLIIFVCMVHHKVSGLIAVLMILFCFITTITVTFAELIQMFQDHSLVSSDIVRNGTLILLEVMLGLHVLAALSDFMIAKFEWLLREWLPTANLDVAPEPKQIAMVPVSRPQEASIDTSKKAPASAKRK